MTNFMEFTSTEAFSTFSLRNTIKTITLKFSAKKKRKHNSCNQTVLNVSLFFCDNNRMMMQWKADDNDNVSHIPISNTFIINFYPPMLHCCTFCSFSQKLSVCLSVVRANGIRKNVLRYNRQQLLLFFCRFRWNAELAHPFRACHYRHSIAANHSSHYNK